MPPMLWGLSARGPQGVFHSVPLYSFLQPHSGPHEDGQGVPTHCKSTMDNDEI